MLSIITIPTTTDLLSEMGTWSKPLFTEFLPYAVYIGGIFIGIALLKFLLGAVQGIFNRITNKDPYQTYDRD